jgi:cobalt transporter subunit CbtA
MIGRVVLAALLAGIAAGLILGAIQHVRITPLILAAEKYEAAMPGHDEGATHGWQPQEGLERTAWTTFSLAMAGAGYAVVLAGISLLTGIPITRGNGLIWGLCGFLAVTVATGAGLPPELPAMASADLLLRQVWWVGTILATGAAIYLIAMRQELWVLALAVVLIALPHVIGAPQPPTLETPIPAGLASEFAANTVAAAAVFWCLIGAFLSIALQKLSRDIHAT